MYRYNTAAESSSLETKYKILSDIISHVGNSKDISSACSFVCNNIIKLGFNNCIIINQVDGKDYTNDGSTDAAFLMGKITDEILEGSANGYKIIDMGYSSYRTKLGYLYINRIKRNDELSGYLILTCYNNELFNHSILSLIDTLITYLGVCFENMQVVNTIKEGLYSDELTGLYNRKYLEELKYKPELTKASKLSLVMLDIDNFKKINDTYGHVFGDRVLEGLAEVLKKELLNISDSIIRYGGEEFLIILPEHDMTQSTKIAENIRMSFNEMPFESNNSKEHFSVSLGVSTSTGQHNFNRLLELADRCLYIAKRKGRNRLVQCSGEINAKFDLLDNDAKLKSNYKSLTLFYKLEFNSNSGVEDTDSFTEILYRLIKQCFKNDAKAIKIDNGKYIVASGCKLRVDEVRDNISFYLKRLNIYSSPQVSCLEAEDGNTSLEDFLELI